MKLTAFVKKDGAVTELEGEVIRLEGKHWLAGEEQSGGGRLCYEIDWEGWKRSAGDSFGSGRYPGIIDAESHPVRLTAAGAGMEPV